MTEARPEIRAVLRETLRALRMFWPLLLAVAAVELVLLVGVGRLLQGERSLGIGWGGFVAWLQLSLVDGLLMSVTYVVIATLVLNGLSQPRLSGPALGARMQQAWPTVVLMSLIGLVPFALSNLVTYQTADFFLYWGVFGAACLASVGISTLIGLAGQEAIARGLPPPAALRASLALTEGHRNWLGFVFLAWLAVGEVIMRIGFELDLRALAIGVTVLGAQPVSHPLWCLWGVVSLPFGIALYLELRRLQAGEGAGLAGVFD